MDEPQVAISMRGITAWKTLRPFGVRGSMYLWQRVVNLCGGGSWDWPCLLRPTYPKFSNGGVAVDTRDPHVSNMKFHILPDLGYLSRRLLPRSRQDKYLGAVSQSEFAPSRFNEVSPHCIHPRILRRVVFEVK